MRGINVTPMPAMRVAPDTEPLPAAIKIEIAKNIGERGSAGITLYIPAHEAEMWIAAIGIASEQARRAPVAELWAPKPPAAGGGSSEPGGES